MPNLSSALRIFFSGAWLSYIGLFRWTRPTTYIASNILMPLASLLFFTFLGISATSAASASFYIVGNAMQVAAVNGIYGVTQSVGNEREGGTLIYLLGAPANRIITFMGRAFFHILDGMLTVVMGFIWGVLLLNLDLGAANMPALALCILITTASVCGMGLLFGSLSLVTLNVMFVNNTVYFLLLVFSGANVALSDLPQWMQAVSFVLPLTRGIAAARLAVDGAALDEISRLLTGEMIVGLIYALFGFGLFSWFETIAKRRGTLEAF